MDNQIILRIENEYREKSKKSILDAKLRKDKVFNQNDTLRKLEDQKNLLAIETAKKIINLSGIDKQIECDNLDLKLKKIDDKIQKELSRMKINEKYFEPIFECDKCKDTGEITLNGVTQKCTCFNQKIINEVYKQANMNKLNEENFNTFDYVFFSNVPNEKKYGMAKSPRENIDQIKKISIDFVKNIDEVKQKNLLFTGNTGLGKTFLANSIDKATIEKAHTVIYQTAPIFLDKLMEYKFSSDESEFNREQYNKIFNVDLLIIDDLGTETMTNNKFTELFNIVNTRLLNNKKILISTNLTLNQLFERYDERLMSRIIGEFTICKFIGDDIRLKKKRMIK